MNCMRCGRETRDDRVFCPKCLEAMERCPVPPDVAVRLPKRQSASPKKIAARKKQISPEEQIARLKRRNRWLTGLVCLLLVLSVLLAVSSARYLKQLDIQQLLGKNYSTVEPTK